jgi:(p)ppGpp synthase/HD superfamily hydrolase
MENHINKLLEKITQQNSLTENKVDISLIKTAIDYIKEYHKHQTRHSGEPYFLHPIEVAYIVSEYSNTNEAILGALLHDTVEDTKFSLNLIKLLFGKNVALIVDKLTKLDSNYLQKIKLSSDENSYKLLHLSEKNKPSLLIKLIDRLHNMRTIRHIKSIEKQKRIASETLKTFVPLAKYLGIQAIEKELESLSLEVLNL